MKLSELIKLHILKRLPALLATAVIVALFSLYYVGILDVSFIQRPEKWKDNIYLFTAIFADEKEETEENNVIQNTEPVPDTKIPEKEDKKEENKKPVDPDEEAPLANILKFETVSAMKEAGYHLTDKVYDESCVFAKLVPEYSWPDKLSYTRKTYDEQKVTTFEDGTESKVETIRASSERPALDLYMGYIIYDDNGVLYLIGPDGAVLRQYSDVEFIPAYTRDKEGRPLFYKNTSYKEEYPTKLSEEENEEGEREWEKTETLTIHDKVYYYLDKNGQTFQKSDYNDATDNRGLYFDYPAYYGTTDSPLKRYYRNTTKFFTDLDSNTTVLDSMNWLFSKETVKVGELEFDKDGYLVTEEEIPEDTPEEERETLTSMFPYTMAYNYSENYATVFMDIDWSYEHDVENDEGKTEKKSFDVTTNELRVINNEGEVMFESRKNFFSNLSWTAHEKYTSPLKNDISSIGSYYFDHGLMRVRLQSWDCYYFAEYDTVKIVTDEDLLIRPNGEVFTIPTGYKLISYSDGVLLLEKDGKYGYLNYLSNWIRDPELLDAKPFLEGIAVCKNNEGNYGAIDTKGNAVIPFHYSYMSNISGGTILAFSESSGWTVYQKMTNQ